MSQSAFATIYRYWHWMGVPVMLIAAAALAWFVHGVVRTVKRAHLLKVSLTEVQDVHFAEAGTVVLSVEGPRFTTRFAGVHFELRDSDGGRIASHPRLFRARTSGISTARIELVAFAIPAPGRYVLRVTGLGPVRENDSRHAIVFMKPHLLKSLAYVVGIVLASAFFIVSLVFFLLRLREAGFVSLR